MPAICNFPARSSAEFSIWAAPPSPITSAFSNASNSRNRAGTPLNAKIAGYRRRARVPAVSAFLAKVALMTNVPTALLRTLITVVDVGSYTRAAAVLGVTQPAVSAQLKRLQVLLGAELFERSTQGVVLSPAG